MSLAENPFANPVPEKVTPLAPAEEGSEVPFTPTDPFWTSTTPNVSDAEIVIGTAINIGHSLAHEAKEEIKSGLKRLFGLR